MKVCICKGVYLSRCVEVHSCVCVDVRLCSYEMCICEGV